MLSTIVKWIVLSPRAWMVTAIAAIAASFVVGYVDAQRTADRALALRQGPPPSVLLQNFRPGQHQGPAREVMVYAEADLASPVVVSIGPEGEEQTAVIVALFPVSLDGQRSLSARLSDDAGLGAIRPVPRPSGDIVRPEAVGVILHWAETADADPMMLIGRTYGVGRYGSVVEVNGERVSAGDMSLVIKGAMAAQETRMSDDFLAIAPFEDGRVEALSTPASSGLQRLLLWGGVALGLGALLLSIGARTTWSVAARVPRMPGEQDRRLSPGSTEKARSRFQTIPTQDELYAASITGKMRNAESDRGPGLLQVARSRMRWLRTRP
jgi:hypothetical protein